MRLLYVTQWFDPEPIFKNVCFAKALIARGHEVEVLTAFPNYPGGKLYPGYRVRPYRRETIDGVVTHRVAVWPSHDRSSLGRAANYVSFFVTTLLFGLLRGGRYDLVHVYHPPVTPAVAAAIFCGLHRRPMTLEVQDLWPDSVAASGMADSRVVRVLGRLCAFVYRRASMILPQSTRMVDLLHARGVPKAKLRRVYNWATYRAASVDQPGLPPEIEIAFRDRFNVVYGGNLGQAQALGDVIDAVVRAASERPGLHLHLFGDGIERAALAARADATGARCVTLHGAVDRVAMDRIFDSADLLVLHLKDDPLYEVTIPSKVQHYLACGRPIVAGVRGEAADLLRASGAAIVRDPEDIAAMADAILRVAAMSPAERRVLGENGRRYYAANMAFDRAIDETLAVFETVAGLHRAISTKAAA